MFHCQTRCRITELIESEKLLILEIFLSFDKIVSFASSRNNLSPTGADFIIKNLSGLEARLDLPMGYHPFGLCLEEPFSAMSTDFFEPKAFRVNFSY